MIAHGDFGDTSKGISLPGSFRTTSTDRFVKTEVSIYSDTQDLGDKGGSLTHKSNSCFSDGDGKSNVKLNLSVSACIPFFANQSVEFRPSRLSLSGASERSSNEESKELLSA